MKIQNFETTVNPFSGNSLVNHHFNKSGMSKLIDNELGVRVKYVGYQYSEIFRNLSNTFLGGGDVIEDINTHFGEHLKSISGNNVPSADTVLQTLKELTTENTSYTSDSGKSYDFNINTKLNKLNIKSLKLTNQLKSGMCYDFDYDNQINANNKWDAKKTYYGSTKSGSFISAIDDNGLNELSVFPNPASDKISIQVNAEKYDLQIYDISGNLKMKLRNVGGTKLIQTNEIGTAGVYFIKVIVDDEVFIKKFILK